MNSTHLVELIGEFINHETQPKAPLFTATSFSCVGILLLVILVLARIYLPFRKLNQVSKNKNKPVYSPALINNFPPPETVISTTV